MRKLAKEAGLIKPKEDECVRVFVRVRPLSHKEKGNGNRKVVFCDADSQERILRQEVERQEKTNIHLEQKFTSLEDEVEVKTVKLKKLIKRFQESKNEIKDMKAQNQREREDLWEMRRELQRQIQLKQLIVDNFIPPSQSSRFEGNVEWDDDKDEWNMVSQEDKIHSLHPVPDP